MQHAEREALLRYEASVVLYHIESNRLCKVLVLQVDAQDCGYAGLAEGEKPGEYLVSYYASDMAPAPCADVYVAHVRVEG
jgi:hypothetical protein